MTPTATVQCACSLNQNSIRQQQVYGSLMSKHTSCSKPSHWHMGMMPWPY